MALHIHDCSTAIECSELTPQSGTMPWICAYLVIDVDCHGGDAAMHDGRAGGSTNSVAYGHSLYKALAFPYIKPEAVAL